MHLITFFVALLLSTYAVSQTPDVTINLETGNSDVITTPNYPNNYGRNANKLWQITAPDGYRIRLHFTDFNTEDGYDFVIIYEGTSGEANMAWERVRFSGDSVPPNVTSINTYMWIRFRSDDRMQSRGFRAIVDAVLIPDVTINLETDNLDVFTTPNYPNNYGRNGKKLWKITAPDGYRIRLHFTDFNTEGGYDFAIIYDGKSGEASIARERVRFSGNSVPPNVTSIKTYMWIRFKSDNDLESRGFRAIVDAVLIPVLTLTDETYILTSPNYPDDYDNNVDIMWQVITPQGFRVMVQFIDFKLNTGDFLALYHGLTDSFSDSTLRANLSGSDLPNYVSSNGSYVWIRFYTNYRDTWTGFSLSLSAEKPDWTCDFQSDVCELIFIQGSWTVGESGNYYFIQADENGATLSIPHFFTSSKGTLSFALYQRYYGGLTVGLCRSQLPIPFGYRNTFQYYNIPYACNGTEDVEIKFTAYKTWTYSLVRVLDIQLFETSVPSTASMSTADTSTSPFAGKTTEHWHDRQTEISTRSSDLANKSTSVSGTDEQASTVANRVSEASRGDLNSAVVPGVSAVVGLLLIGLVIVAVVLYLRKRYATEKTADPSDGNDDDPTLYNNPVYSSKDGADSTPDLLVGISSPDARNDAAKGGPLAQHNSSSLATPEKETSNLPSYYSVHYPSKGDVNKETKSKDFEDEDCTYENVNGQQSDKDPKKVSTGKPETNKAGKAPSSATSQGRGKPDAEKNSGKKASPDSTAVLADDEEYNALTFNQSADITRALKKPKAGGLNVVDGYGVLDLPEDKSSMLQPNSQELHNDGVYSSLDEPPQEHHRGKQEIKGPRPKAKPNKTDQPDYESEYHNYQDPNQMDPDRPDLGKSQEPDAISDDQYDILQSGKQAGNQHVYQQMDDADQADVDQGYYVNLGANVGNEDEYSTIYQGPSHTLGESEAHGFEPIYSDEVYSEFN